VNHAGACSTPFGINERTTTPHSAERVLEKVLNAFRHQRKNHGGGLGGCAVDGQCSTPFGINERTTWTSDNITLNGYSAQRLSASTKEPRTTSRSTEVSEMCSTPFGINERTTERRVGQDLGVDQCSTPFGINERTTNHLRVPHQNGISAQRLSASTKEPPRSTARAARPTSGAQRLSASTKEPRLSFQPARPPQLALG